GRPGRRIACFLHDLFGALLFPYTTLFRSPRTRPRRSPTPRCAPRTAASTTPQPSTERPGPAPPGPALPCLPARLCPARPAHHCLARHCPAQQRGPPRCPGRSSPAHATTCTVTAPAGGVSTGSAHTASRTGTACGVPSAQEPSASSPNSTTTSPPPAGTS